MPPELSGIRGPNTTTLVVPVVVPQTTEIPAHQGQVAVPRDRTIDEQHAAIHVARHHQDSANPAAKGIGALSGLTKIASSGLKSTGALVHNEATHEALKHGGTIAGEVGEGVALLQFAVSAYDVHQAGKVLKQAETAQKELSEIADNIGTQDATNLSLDELKNKFDAVSKGQEAKDKRVESSLKMLKSGGLMSSVGMTAAHIGAGAAPLVAGAAAGIAMAGMGGYMVYRAGQQRTQLENKTSVLVQAAASNKVDRESVNKLKAAAEDIKESRARHISNSKWGGIAKIGLGLSTLALLGVAVVAGAALAVSAPVVLPVLSLGLLAATVSAVATRVVRGVEAKRSEGKVNTMIDAAVKAEGMMAHEEIQSLTSEKMFKKTSARDTVRMGKINEGVAALHTMLISLASTGLQETKRADIIAFLTDSRVVDGPQKKILEDQLKGLNVENFEQSKGPLLAMLAKQMM
jgi:hypothetical protein